MKLCVGLVALGLALPLPGGGPSAPKTVPVVVELFTSEGCSSCPPADALLARLLEPRSVPGAEVIALSEHVDYWNRLGWTDPYSSKEFSERQSRYAGARGTTNIYTPQMVVDGRAEFVGSDARRAREEIAKAARERKAEVDLSRDGRASPLRVRVATLPSLERGDMAEVLLAIVEDGLTSDIRRGENAGRRLSHVGVVRRLETLGVISGSPPAFERRVEVAADPAWKPGRLRAVAFVQERASRRILGAAQIGL